MDPFRHSHNVRIRLRRLARTPFRTVSSSTLAIWALGEPHRLVIARRLVGLFADRFAQATRKKSYVHPATPFRARGRAGGARRACGLGDRSGGVSDEAIPERCELRRSVQVGRSACYASSGWRGSCPTPFTPKWLKSSKAKFAELGFSALGRSFFSTVPHPPKPGYIGQRVNARGVACATFCILQPLVARQCKGGGFGIVYC